MIYDPHGALMPLWALLLILAVPSFFIGMAYWALWQSRRGH